ncbi:Subunit IV of cytochrome c oxidase [Venustampulla echinocandica]|uniref:Subunit IV of cytochrome c oxidase n=1 Tax=Venustampulla echinocandica TaxID=2656787 RepID=A0A370TVX8_9HELO|nr:Subunit IV of cytochrome c oxidase [Venustampulla echinocandica]RDL39684.1 Subunit IV of cytochrome c oxidase [Venustampulla echinocandica]
MFLQRTAVTAARRAAASPIARRSFATTFVRRDATPTPTPATGSNDGKIKKFNEIKSEADLIGPGAAPGTIPTDLEQATGLDRLEILGKMQGIDVFDMKPLDASRKGTIQPTSDHNSTFGRLGGAIDLAQATDRLPSLGTLDNPIMVKSAGDEQYAGCTGYPADSHVTIWLTMSRERPVERCPECGNVLKMEYIGPEEDPHAHDHGDHHHAAPEEPKTFVDFVKPEYR